MTGSVAMTERERVTGLVYGDTFALYDAVAFDAFIAPLYARLAANGISRGVFAGKRCLDAGCGGGRGSVMMAESGAREVVAVDLSPTNVASTRKRAAERGLGAITVDQHSLMSLPFPDESFDVVWCNGVLHHTTDADRGLSEITRVLKRGGVLWLYLYGSGGISWRMVDWVRSVLRDVDVQEAIYQLRLLGAPVPRIAEWVDNWFVPYLRRYTAHDVTRRLRELGYDDATLLARGVTYDTSERRHVAPAERALMGEGDLRYFCRKLRAATPGGSPLPDTPDHLGSTYVDADSVTRFDPLFRRISTALDAWDTRRGVRCSLDRLVVARSVHTCVRSLLEANAPFDVDALQSHLEHVGWLLTQMNQLAGDRNRPPAYRG